MIWYAVFFAEEETFNVYSFPWYRFLGEKKKRIGCIFSGVSWNPWPPPTGVRKRDINDKYWMKELAEVKIEETAWAPRQLYSSIPLDSPVLQLRNLDVTLNCPLGPRKLTSSCLSGRNLLLENEEEIKRVESKEWTLIFSQKHENLLNSIYEWEFYCDFFPRQARQQIFWWELLGPRDDVMTSLQHKFILKQPDPFLWEGQHGIEKEKGGGGN